MNTKEPNTNPPHQFCHHSHHQLLKWSSWFLPPLMFSPPAGTAAGSTCTYSKKKKKYHPAHPFTAWLIITHVNMTFVSCLNYTFHTCSSPYNNYMFHTLELRLLNVAAVIIIEDVEDILDFLGRLWGEATQLEEPFVAEGFRGWKHETQM